MKSLEINTFIESKLAVYLTANPILVPVVDKVSKFIISFIDSNRRKITEALSNDQNLNALCDDIYGSDDVKILGRLAKPNESPIRIETVLKDIVDILSKNIDDKTNTLLPTLAIHSAVGFRLLRLLESNKYETLGQSFKGVSELLSIKKTENLIMPGDNKKLVTKLGVSGLKTQVDQMAIVLPDAVGKIAQSVSTLEHRPSEIRYTTDVKKLRELLFKTTGLSFDNMPLVVGPSSHISMLLTSLKVYIEDYGLNLSEDEFYEYAFADTARLVASGYHTFSEALLIAEKFTSRKFTVSYEEMLPKSLQLNDFVRKLINCDGLTIEKEEESQLVRNTFAENSKFALFPNRNTTTPNSVTSKIRCENVVFDIGKVLMLFDAGKVFHKVFGPDIDLKACRASTLDSPEWSEFDKANINESDMVLFISRSLNCDLSTASSLMWEIKEEWKPDPEMLVLMDNLAARNINLYALSNMPLSIQAHLENKYPEFWAKFKGIVISSRVKLAKPDLEIYKLLLANYQLIGERTWFFDDCAENLTSAEKLLMTARLFTSAKNCRLDVEELSNDCPDEKMKSKFI